MEQRSLEPVTTRLGVVLGSDAFFYGDRALAFTISPSVSLLRADPRTSPSTQAPGSSTYDHLKAGAAVSEQKGAEVPVRHSLLKP